MTPLPPGPRSSLIETARLIHDPYESLRRLRARYGDVVTFPALNGKLVIALAPAGAKEVFTASPEAFGSFGADAMGPILDPRSMLISEGDQHRRDRKLLTPPFHGARMRAYGDAMRSIARARFAKWRVGDRVKIHDATTAITLDVILRTVFGVDEGPQFDEGRAIMEDVVARLDPLLLFTPKLHTPLYPPWRWMLRTQERVRRWIFARIAEGRARGEGREDVLGLMLAARYDDGTAMSDEEIAVQLVTLLLAGHETTAISLAWATHWLMRHPIALAKLRSEIDGVGADAEPETLARLPYLGAVCDETLRMHPIVTEVVRTLRAPLRVGGWDLPAGIGVGVGIATIHEDPELYPEPFAFRPERFLERKFGPFEHLPFGGGHRRCLGAAFALYEMKLVLAALVGEWELAPAGPIDERPVRRNLTMGPEHGVLARVRGRRTARRPRSIAADVLSAE